MEYTAAVGIGDRLADVGEPVEQVPQRQRALVEVAVRVFIGAMELRDRSFEAGPTNEAHRIERPAAVVDPQTVDGDDTRVLEPAGDLGLPEEPRAAVGVVGAFGLIA
jgi:hypothetical protein